MKTNNASTRRIYNQKMIRNPIIYLLQILDGMVQPCNKLKTTTNRLYNVYSLIFARARERVIRVRGEAIKFSIRTRTLVY